MDYKVQVLGDNLREPVSGTSTFFVIFSRFKTDEDDMHNALDVKKKLPRILFPNSSGGLLPSEFYSQLRE